MAILGATNVKIVLLFIQTSGHTDLSSSKHLWELVRNIGGPVR